MDRRNHAICAETVVANLSESNRIASVERVQGMVVLIGTCGKLIRGPLRDCDSKGSTTCDRISRGPRTGEHAYKARNPLFSVVM
jgi:hypothetical protein